MYYSCVGQDWTSRYSDRYYGWYYGLGANIFGTNIPDWVLWVGGIAIAAVLLYGAGKLGLVGRAGRAARRVGRAVRSAFGGGARVYYLGPPVTHQEIEKAIRIAYGGAQK